ncbi:MAG TPA: ABC transporter ATP-binding protein [Candidatus Limnocylindrales bacterium]|nr:ABC transporter ATP-binding protein [Candidatus Limnocylindrales bacterium]
MTLALESVSYVYQPGSVRALDGVSLHIARGERAAIIGQNGSGKTTFVRHLNGLLRPDAGRVLIDGTDAAQRTVAELARSVGLVFQDPDRQIFAGSVRTEVEFGPRNLGLRGGALRAAADEALEAVGLAAEARTNPYDLGASRRKLLALASVLSMRTPILVLDEPTTGQDAAGTEVVRSVIERAHADGRTVIVISHDMEFVASAFDRIIVMRDGTLIGDGAPASVFAAPGWDQLRSTHLEPTLAARVGERLGLDATPTDAALLASLASSEGGVDQ